MVLPGLYTVCLGAVTTFPFSKSCSSIWRHFLETHYLPHFHRADLNLLLDLTNPLRQCNLFSPSKICQSCFLPFLFFSVTLPIQGLLRSVCHSSPAFTIFPVMESEDGEQGEMEAAEMKQTNNKTTKSQLCGRTGQEYGNPTTTCIEQPLCKLKPEYVRCIISDAELSIKSLSFLI